MTKTTETIVADIMIEMIDAAPIRSIDKALFCCICLAYFSHLQIISNSNTMTVLRPHLCLCQWNIIGKSRQWHY